MLGITRGANSFSHNSNFYSTSNSRMCCTHIEVSIKKALAKL